MLKEIFEPYLFFISLFITVVVNIYLITKNVNWIILVVANIILIIVMKFIGLEEYNLLNIIFKWLFETIADFISNLFSTIIDAIGDMLSELVPDFLKPKPTPKPPIYMPGEPPVID